MPDRLKMVPFLWSEIEEADRLAGIDQRMLADEILDFGFVSSSSAS
jgi:hypothetical protein